MGIGSPGPTDRVRDFSARSWRDTLVRTVKEFLADNLTDAAAALTYYTVLSVFPALIVLVAIVGLFGDPASTTETLTDVIAQAGPDSAAETFRQPIEGITAHRETAGALLIVGLGVAVWSASAYVGAFMRASNVVYGVPEGRSFWKLQPLRLVVTLGMVLAAALVSMALVISGPLAAAVGDALGVGDAAVTAWEIAKWPVLALLVLTMISVLYYVSPNVKLRGWRLVTPGSVLALALWGVASAGFSFYVANFGRYDKIYGALGGVVTFLVWLWLTNIAILLGSELDSELERERQLVAGVPGAGDQIQLEPREPAGPEREPAP
jgi:membrane protein